MLEISVEELISKALKACINMLPWLDQGRGELAQEIFDMCDKPIPEFQNFILNSLSSKLHSGEPLEFAIGLVNHPGYDPGDRGWMLIQSELGELCTEEWLDKVLQAEGEPF